MRAGRFHHSDVAHHREHFIRRVHEVAGTRPDHHERGNLNRVHTLLDQIGGGRETADIDRGAELDATGTAALGGDGGLLRFDTGLEDHDSRLACNGTPGAAYQTPKTPPMHRAALTVVSILAAGALLLAQGLTFRSSSDLVRIYATVTRGDGQYVRDLKAED